MNHTARAAAIAVTLGALLVPAVSAVPTVVPAAAGPAPSAAASRGVPAAGAPRGPSKILLTPTADMATSQEVSWTMPARLAGQRVQYRIPGRASAWATAARRPATRKATSGTTLPRYEATMGGLRPGTTYQYRIVTGRGSSSWRSFTTADPGAPVTTVLGLGDTQVANLGVPRSTIRQALAAAPRASLVLQAGDLVDRPSKGRQWDELFTAIGDSGRTRNWVVSIGNHEQCVLIRCDSGAGAAFRSYFDWPDNGVPGQGETWFYVDHQAVRIIVLDSFGGQMAEQARFLDQALASNPLRWSIVLMHAPAFASQPSRTNPEVVARWLPIIERHDVDLVLTGHDHAYARGYLQQDGPVYVTSVSGPKYYEVTDADWLANGATRQVWAAGTSTFQVITIAGNSLEYRAVVSHRGTGSTAQFGPGGLLDLFVIEKSATGKVVR